MTSRFEMLTPRAGEGVPLVHQTFGMDPAQGMLADVELSSIVADHHGFAQEPVRAHGAP